MNTENAYDFLAKIDAEVNSVASCIALVSERLRNYPKPNEELVKHVSAYSLQIDDACDLGDKLYATVLDSLDAETAREVRAKWRSLSNAWRHDANRFERGVVGMGWISGFPAE